MKQTMSKKEEVVESKEGKVAVKIPDFSNLSVQELRKIVRPRQVERIDQPRVLDKEAMAAVIELYKRQNPAKYELKKAELERDFENSPN